MTFNKPKANLLVLERTSIQVRLKFQDFLPFRQLVQVVAAVVVWASSFSRLAANLRQGSISMYT